MRPDPSLARQWQPCSTPNSQAKQIEPCCTEEVHKGTRNLKTPSTENSTQTAAPLHQGVQQSSTVPRTPTAAATTQHGLNYTHKHSAHRPALRRLAPTMRRRLHHKCTTLFFADGVLQQYRATATATRTSGLTTTQRDVQKAQKHGPTADKIQRQVRTCVIVLNPTSPCCSPSTHCCRAAHPAA